MREVFRVALDQYLARVGALVVEGPGVAESSASPSGIHFSGSKF
jgi:hypothetical protein